jgi:LuxR family maltose regulon positive regulatory protein
MDFDLETIIKSKIIRPPVRKATLLRKRLHDLLVMSLDQKLTLISAPAGYGKTTLTSDWLNQMDFPIAWFSIDTLDNYPNRFLLYLINSLKNSKIQSSIEMGSKHPDPEYISLKSTFDHVFNSICDHTPFTIAVLDDYHLIQNPVIHEMVSYIIHNQPPLNINGPDGGKGVHWVIVTRQDPPFQLARWRLHQELSEIRINDLRFFREEIRIILNQIQGLELTADDIADLDNRTEGWIAGIQMAAISLKSQKAMDYTQFIQHFKGKNRLISDYLVEEVLEKQTEEIREFLIDTSILERLNGELCSAVTGNQNSFKILEVLERNNIFLNSLDDERIWYRFHQLFLDVLRYQFKLLPQERQNALHERAAVWFEENKYLDECLFHWLSIERYDQAARFIAKVSPSLLKRGQFMKVRDLVETIPEQIYEGWPWLPIYRAWACFMLKPDSVEYWLEMAERALDEASSVLTLDQSEIKEMRGNIAALHSYCAVRRGEIDAANKFAPVAMDLLPEHVNKVRGLVLLSIASVQFLKGQFSDALQVLLQSKVILIKGGNIGGAAEALNLMGEIKMIQGKLREASELFQEAIALGDSQNDSASFFTCTSYSGLGTILFEWGQVDKALKYLKQGYNASKSMGCVERVYCGTALVNAYLSLGDLELAEQYLCACDLFVASHIMNPWFDARLISSRILLLAARKNLSALQQLVLEVENRDDSENTINREMINLTYILACYRLGDLNSVIRMSNQLEPELETGKRWGRLTWVLAMKAAALNRLGNKKEALSEMTRCLNTCSPESYFRTFLDLGDPILEIASSLFQQKETNVHHPFLKKIINAFLSSNNENIHVSEKITHLKGLLEDPLTEQELRVLHLMMSDLNNNEIALALGVSVNTIKSHTAHIYEKLSVHNRIQAVTRARQLGLLNR